MRNTLVDKSLLLAVATEFRDFGIGLHGTGTTQARRYICRRLLTETGREAQDLGVRQSVEFKADGSINLNAPGLKQSRNLFGLTYMAVGSDSVGNQMIGLADELIRLFHGR